MLRTMRYGRFSNKLFGFIESAAIAAALNRTLLTPAMDRCQGTKMADMYDLPRLSAFAPALEYADTHPNTSLATPAFCGSATPSDPAPFTSVLSRLWGDEDRWEEGPFTMFGVAWNGTWVPRGQGEIPLGTPFRSGDNTDVQGSRIFQDYYSGEVRNLMGYTMVAPELVAYMALQHRHRCIAINSLFVNTNWAVIPQYFLGVMSHLYPAPGVNGHVLAFVAKHGLDAAPFIGLHMRLTDMAEHGGQPGYSRSCVKDRDNNTMVRIVEEHIAKWRLQGAVPPPKVAIASDDFNSGCAQTLLAHLGPDRAVKVDSGGIYDPTSCIEAVFDQDILARSSYFLGHAQSTYSTVIHWLRTVREGHAISTTVML
jgi:hypothetical protein